MATEAAPRQILDNKRRSKWIQPASLAGAYAEEEAAVPIKARSSV